MTSQINMLDDIYVDCFCGGGVERYYIADIGLRMLTPRERNKMMRKISKKLRKRERMADQKERLKKLYALALRGVGGEKEQAQALLEKLLKKYDMSIDDLDDEQSKEYHLTYHGKEQRKLLIQTVYKVLGDTSSLFELRYSESGRKCRTILSVSCTAAQKAEIDFLFDFYTRLWEKEREALLEAFIQKHRIFGCLKDDEEGIRLSDEEFKKMVALMMGLSDEQPLWQIEGCSQ